MVGRAQPRGVAQTGRRSETRAETDPRVGGAFRIVMVGDESSIVASGTYREIDRPRRLVFTWSSPDTRLRDTIVTVTFQPSSNGTVVEIHQVGLPDEDARTSHYEGWSDVLRELGRTTHAKKQAAKRAMRKPELTPGES